MTVRRSPPELPLGAQRVCTIGFYERITDVSTTSTEQAELGRFLTIAGRRFAAGQPAPEMFSPAVDAAWHELLDSPGYPAFCAEHAGRSIGHAPGSGAGPVSWVRDYEALFGVLPELWFTDRDGRVDREGVARYRETGVVVAEWDCSPVPGDGGDDAVPVPQREPAAS